MVDERESFSFFLRRGGSGPKDASGLILANGSGVRIFPGGNVVGHVREGKR